MSLELTLVRHGATAWNEGGRWQGITDVPLGTLGEGQARELGEVLRREIERGQPFDRVYASDLTRAVQTAELALPDAPLYLDVRLREFNFGDYEGLTVPQMQAHPAFADWQADPWHRRIPNGDSLDDVAAHMQDWLSEVSDQFPAGRLIAFSHSVAIRTLLVSLFGTPLEPQPDYPIPYRERIGNAKWVTLRREGGGWVRGG